MASSGTGFAWDKIIRDGFAAPTQANRLTDSPSWSLYNMTGIVADRDITMTGKVFFEVACGTPYGSYGAQGFYNPNFFTISGNSTIGGTSSGNADASLAESIRRSSTGNSAGNSRYCIGFDNNNGTFGYYDPGGATRHFNVTRANGSSLYASSYAASFAYAIDFDNSRMWVGVSDYTSASSWYWFGPSGGGADPETASTGLDLTEWLATNGGREARLQFYHGANDTSGDHFSRLNPGTDPTFGGLISQGGGNTDANGFGNYMHPLPAGYRGMMSASEPTSANIDPAETNDDYPEKLFTAHTYTGNGGSQSINIGFQPDLVWIKNRDGANSHLLLDSSRGATKSFKTDGTDAEATTYSSVFTAFTSTGFTLSQADAGMNNSSVKYIAWCWRAGGGSTSSNGDGSITTNVQASTAAGFSIITYTGTGSNATIGHGLTQAPTFVMCKNLSDTDYMGIYHASRGETYYGTLPSSSAPSTNSTFWNDTAPTNSVISLGSQNRVNGSGNSMVCYAWHDVAGFSKFGKFRGCGTNDFGPKVTTGFKPELVMIKALSGSENWVVWDAPRSNNTNPVEDRLQWNNNSAEATSSSSKVDFHANGFRPILNNSEINGGGTDYMYAAWGKTPFKYGLAF